MLYSKNGSIPKEQTDGTEGWIEVPYAPEAPTGKEVVWWYPPGWVIRDPQPEAREGYVWKWSQTDEQWVEYAIPEPVVEVIIQETVEIDATISAEIASLTTSQITSLEA